MYISNEVINKTKQTKTKKIIEKQTLFLFANVLEWHTRFLERGTCSNADFFSSNNCKNSHSICPQFSHRASNSSFMRLVNINNRIFLYAVMYFQLLNSKYSRLGWQTICTNWSDRRVYSPYFNAYYSLIVPLIFMCNN